MARIRSIKPEIRRSRTVCSWPYPVRWTFAGLPGYLDDEGRGLDDVRLIKAELYPLDDDMTVRKLEQHLIAIGTNGPLCRYEVDGEKYMHVTSWAEHQRVNRPTPSRIPPCPIHEKDVNPHGGLTEPSLPRAQARASAEQGREGSREQGGATDAPTLDGSRILAAYIRRHGALPRQVKQRLGEQIDQLIHDGVSEPQVCAALDAWAAKPDAGPGLLPHLVKTAPASADPAKAYLRESS